MKDINIMEGEEVTMDLSGTELVVELIEDGMDADLTGASVELYAVESSAESFGDSEYIGEATVVNSDTGVVRYVWEENDIVTTGGYDIFFVVTVNEETHTYPDYDNRQTIEVE